MGPFPVEFFDMAAATFRPPAAAQRVLDRRRHRAHRRRRGARRRPTACRRSRSPTSPTCSAWSSSTRRRAARGVKPIVGCDVWITQRRRARQAVPRCCCCAQSRAGYLRLCDCCRAPGCTNQHRGRAEIARANGSTKGTDGLIALSGARDGDVGQALLQGNADGRRARWRASWASAFPRRFYLEVQRAGHADDEALRRARRCALAGELGAAGGGDASGAVPRAATTSSAHEARVCIAEGHVLADQRRPRRFTPEQYFKTQAEMARAVRRPAAGARQLVEIAQRCNLTIPLGKNQLPRVPDAAGRDARRPPARARRRRARAAARGSCIPMPPCASGSAPRYRERLEFETDDHHADGLRRLLPDRRRLHQLGEAQRRAGRARAAARARARSSRTRSASPTSTRCATTCCSSASSIPSACRCPTSTSTSARTAATA